MKKQLLVFLTVAAFSTLLIAPALADQHNGLYIKTGPTSDDITQIGDVHSWNDGENLYVQFNTWMSEWVLMETHVAVAVDIEDIPQTKTGNPKVGNFPYKHEGLGGVKEDTVYVIPLSDINSGVSSGDTIVIAAHAVVSGPCGEETAWGNCGYPKGYFPGRNWAMFFYYAVT